ncbi:MAG: hypothetical protein HRU10_10910 [Opitutales bacterium]|nr:hypothetical protein [Opitutales bacterium]
MFKALFQCANAPFVSATHSEFGWDSFGQRVREDLWRACVMLCAVLRRYKPVNAFRVSSTSTSAYAQARERLKTALIQDAYERVLNALGAGETVPGFAGHRIHLVDSTTVTAADTPDTQKCFTQSSQCAPGHFILIEI